MLGTTESEGRKISVDSPTSSAYEWHLSLPLIMSCSELACGLAQSHESEKVQSYLVLRRHRKLRWVTLVSTKLSQAWTEHPPSPEKVHPRLHSCQANQTSPLPLLLFWATSLEERETAYLNRAKSMGVNLKKHRRGCPTPIYSPWQEASIKLARLR